MGTICFYHVGELTAEGKGATLGVADECLAGVSTAFGKGADGEGVLKQGTEGLRIVTGLAKYVVIWQGRRARDAPHKPK